MRVQVVKSLSDDRVTARLNSLAARGRAHMAVLLVYLREFDTRRLYLPAGYSSMHAYCVEALKFSDDEAYARIRVARAGSDVPALLAALEDGRIHMTAARLLAPHLTLKNAEELMAAAAGRNRFEVESMIKRRFGTPPLPPLATTAVATTVALPTPTSLPIDELVSKRVEFPRELADFEAVQAKRVCPSPSDDVDAPNAAPMLHAETPTATPAKSVDAPTLAVEWSTPVTDSVDVELQLPRETYERLQYARLLLGHALPSGDMAGVIDRALTLLIAKLEKQKFASAKRPKTAAAAPKVSAKRTDVRTRYIPANVKRVVWVRDGGRCTYIAPSGRRCESRHRIEFHHVKPFALGGASTVDGLRLRCRAHNQYEAEQDFGVEFIAGKRLRPPFNACTGP